MYLEKLIILHHRAVYQSKSNDPQTKSNEYLTQIFFMFFSENFFMHKAQRVTDDSMFVDCPC